MSTNFLFDAPMRAGTAGGTLLVIFLQVTGNEVLRTSVLAVFGAVVSFFVSLVLKWAMRKVKKRINKGKPYCNNKWQ